MAQISYSVSSDGVAVSFAYDKALVAEFKAAFKTAKFNGWSKTWLVSGITAEKRVKKWIECREKAAAERQDAAEAEAKAMRAEIDFEGPIGVDHVVYDYANPWVILRHPSIHFASLADVLTPLGATETGGGMSGVGRGWKIPAGSVPMLRAMAADLNARMKDAERRAADQHAEAIAATVTAITTGYINLKNNAFEIHTPYDDRIVSAIRTVPGVEWDRYARVWRAQATKKAAEALLAVIPTIEGMAREAQAAEDAKRAAENEVRSRRFVSLLDRLPAVGATIRQYKQVITITEHGKTWRMSEDYADAFAGDLLGHEGESVCYVYYREATAEEVAGLEACEVAKARAAAEKAAARASLCQLETKARQEGEHPEGSRAVDGETLIELDRGSRIYGGGSWWVAADDGLWYVRNNGMDGDNWAANNVLTGGAGAIGWRLPRDASLETELRRIAAVIGA